jgi:hypothetical protein
VAQGAGDADSDQLSLLVHRTLHADDGIEAQELNRHRGIGQVDLAGAQGADDRLRKSLEIDLQADRERRGRIDGRNDLVHSQHVGPELLVSEGVEAEDVLPARRDRARPLPIVREARQCERDGEEIYERAGTDQSHRLSLLSVLDTSE